MFTKDEKLSIRKIKDWYVIFRYGGKEYMLHEENDDGYSGGVGLWERERIGTNGHYRLNMLLCDWSAHGVSEFLRDKGSKVHKTSTPMERVDIEHFREMLIRSFSQCEKCGKRLVYTDKPYEVKDGTVAYKPVFRCVRCLIDKDE